MTFATDLLDILHPGPRRSVRRCAPLIERLAAKIDYRGPGECWPWVGTLNPYGYGMLKMPGGRFLMAHRLVYELLVGPIPEGLTLDHECHNRDKSCVGTTCLHRRCCNPVDLTPATARENTLNGHSVMASRAAQTHCVHGHEFTPENTYRSPGRGTRQCRICIGIRNARQKSDSVSPYPSTAALTGVR